MPSTHALGTDIEERAIAYLLDSGLGLLARNYRCRHGEIDAVMRADAVIVFVEVRYRRTGSHGGPAASVDRHKRKRLLKTAAHFLQRHFPDREPHCRFDVIVASGSPQAPAFEWISDAFQA